MLKNSADSRTNNIQIMVSIMCMRKKHHVILTAGLTEQCPNYVFVYGFPSLVS